MITEHNGLLLLPRGEDHSDHPVVKALESVSLGDVCFPHGFFLINKGGTPYVLPASAEDRLQRLQKAFPERTREELSVVCGPTDPGCEGDCGDPRLCEPVSVEGDGWYGCVCVNVGSST